MKNSSKIFSILVCAIIITVGFYFLPSSDDYDLSANNQIVAPDFIPQYSLINQDSEIVTEKTYSGQYQLVYFGFTFCPDICPTELQKMTIALNSLSEEQLNVTQPIFISVDPERDTPPVMKQYLESFHSKFSGFTGTEDTVDVAIDGFKIYAAKVDDPNLSEYTINHSSYIYLIAPNGDLLALYKKEDGAEKVSESLNKFISASAVQGKS